jgi:hypothetical protein
MKIDLLVQIDRPNVGQYSPELNSRLKDIGLDQSSESPQKYSANNKTSEECLEMIIKASEIMKECQDISDLQEFMFDVQHDTK